MTIKPFITGIYEEVENLPEVKLFPNPCSDILTIDLLGQEKMEIELVDVTGRIISKHMPKHQQLQIDLSAYSSGIYFVRIVSKSGILTKKLIIK